MCSAKCGTVDPRTANTSSANTLVVVRPASAQGSLSLQLQLIAKPTDEERGASKRMSPLYNLHSAHRGHRASVTDAATDERVAKLSRCGDIEINDLVNLTLVQGRNSACPSPASCAASNDRLSLAGSSSSLSSSLPHSSKLMSKIRRKCTSQQDSDSPSKPSLEGLMSFGLAHALPSLGETLDNASPAKYSFDVARPSGKRAPREQAVRMEWRRQGEEGQGRLGSHSMLSVDPLKSPTISFYDSEKLLSVPSTPTRMQRTPSTDRPSLRPSPLSYDGPSTSCNSSIAPSSRSRSSSLSSESASSYPPTPSRAGRWTLYLSQSTSYGYTDLVTLATLTATPLHPRLVAHVSVPQLSDNMEIGLSTDELEECMSVLCLWLLMRKAGIEAEGGKRRGSK